MLYVFGFNEIHFELWVLVVLEMDITKTPTTTLSFSSQKRVVLAINFKPGQTTSI